MVLKLVPKEPKPKPTARERIARGLAAATPSYLLICPRCSGSELIETITGVEVRNGKHCRGTKVKLCLSCFSRGQRVEVR